MNKWIALTLLSISTSALAGESVTYQANGKEYEGYWAKVNDNAPTVLLVHDWDGLTDYEKKRAEMLNELGYNVFAVDMFGKGRLPSSIDENKQFTGELYKDRAKMRAIMDASRSAAMEQSSSKQLIVMGYCFGGAVILESARAGMQADGFVSFHGGLATPEGQTYAQTTAPVLILHGTADQVVSMEQFADLASQLEATKIEHEMVTYSGARHAFTVFDSNRYHEQADKKSWTQFTQFLDEKTRS